VGGLTPAELARIRGRLEAFADDVFASLARADQRARGEGYLRGLMLDGRRKSIEPMAQRLGEVHYQALHHFVAVSPWDWRPVRRRLAEVLCGALSPTAWVVDDTGFPKDGTHSVGVQRQYSGTLGKRANCQLGVSVNAVTEQASCPLDWRLFVPECWDEEAMAARRAACHLPEQVHHRPKWQLVVDMLDELAGWDLVPPVLLADSGYGEVGQFRGDLDARQVPYVVEVQAATSAYPEQVHPVAAPYAGTGSPAAAALPPATVLASPACPGSGAAGLCGPDLAAWQQGAATRPLRGAAGAPGRDHPTPAGTSRRWGAAGALAAGRVAQWEARAGQVLAVQPARGDSDRGAGAAGQVALASGTGLPRTQGRPGAGPLRGPRLARLAPPRHAGLGRARLPYPGAAPLPKSGGVGLTLWQLLGELQVLLACWAGACPVCRRPAPRWLRCTGRPRVPT
jgi:hypothetical protein